MASSSYNPYVTLEVGEEYPYPSHVCAPNFVTLKLSGRDNHGMWKTQMICLLQSHGMLRFINGALVSPKTNVSGKEKVGDHHHHWLWTRSDALVQGWILGSLSEKTLRHVLNRLTKTYSDDFNAKDVWDELQTIYGPAVLPQLQVAGEARAELHEELYEAILLKNWDWADQILGRKKVTVIDKITKNGNTALHVVVGSTKKQDVLEKWLELTPDNTQLLDLRNSDGSTLLHVAAIIGNTEAAKILVARNPDLLFGKDNEGQTPLAIAVSNIHTETAQHMLQHIDTHIHRDTLFSGTTGDELLVTVISSKDFSLACRLVSRYKALHGQAVLMAIAQNFPYELNMLEKYIGIDIRERIPDLASPAMVYMFNICWPLCGYWAKVILSKLRPFFVGIRWIIMLFLRILKMLVWPFAKNRIQTHVDAVKLLENVCRLITDSNDPSLQHQCYTDPFLEAARQNAYEVVDYIVRYFPNAMWCVNKDGHDIIQYAVISRSEKIYNLIYQMSEHKNVYRTMKDFYGNNLLHLAARLAPSDKLNLISGAALQVQRELQWFKEVEGFVCPLNIIQKNSFDETPQMVFTKEHKDLVIDGEKWMKTTAESYTITAALITTIVFAAAITVPGGNNQDTGMPVFTNNIAFKVFAISDAISLFAAVTSLLMFLSILTARFAEKDFLFKLPTKLIIGLSTLFISTTAMIIAFGATLYLVFGQSNSRILIPIAVLTCLPITSFMTLQFPLVIELISATYGQSIFGKKRDSLFY